MSTNEWTWPTPIPGFSTLKMKQELQERVYRNTKGMTDEEVRDYIRKGAERFDKRMDELRAKKQRETADYPPFSTKTG